MTKNSWFSSKNYELWSVWLDLFHFISIKNVIFKQKFRITASNFHNFHMKWSIFDRKSSINNHNTYKFDRKPIFYTHSLFKSPQFRSKTGHFLSKIQHSKTFFYQKCHFWTKFLHFSFECSQFRYKMGNFLSKIQHS